MISWASFDALILLKSMENHHSRIKYVLRFNVDALQFCLQ